MHGIQQGVVKEGSGACPCDALAELVRGARHHRRPEVLVVSLHVRRPVEGLVEVLVQPRVVVAQRRVVPNLATAPARLEPDTGVVALRADFGRQLLGLQPTRTTGCLVLTSGVCSLQGLRAGRCLASRGRLEPFIVEEWGEHPPRCMTERAVVDNVAAAPSKRRNGIRLWRGSQHHKDTEDNFRKCRSP